MLCMFTKMKCKTITFCIHCDSLHTMHNSIKNFPLFINNHFIHKSLWKHNMDLQNNEGKRCSSSLDHTWTSQSTVKCRVYFNSTEKISNIDKNWNEKLEAIIRLIKSWEKRNLSIIGKIHIIKTFLLSQLTYIMQSLVLPDDVLKKLNTILFKFIWKKKYSNRRAFEKIRRDVLCGDYENGGLKMINAFDMQNAFIIKWVKNVYCNKWASYSCIPVMYYEKLGYDFSVLRSSVRSKHFTGFNEIRSQYWFVHSSGNWRRWR